MRIFLSVLVLIFSLQSLTKADDISEFEIEGISIGDSLLDYYNDSKIQDTKMNYLEGKRNFYVVGVDDGSKLYDNIEFYLKTGDKKYILHNLSGVLIYQNNIQDCYPKMDEISLSIENNFSYNKKYNKDSFKHAGDSTGKSIITDITYKFKDGYIVILCYDYSKEHGGQDHLSVAIDTNELNKWLIDDAWK